MKVLSAGILTFVTAAGLGCAGTVDYLATDGQRFHKRDAWNYAEIFDSEAALGAVRASAAHDLPCPAGRIEPRYVARQEYVADGCGSRVVYRAELLLDQDPHLVRHVLTGRFTLGPPRPAQP